MKMTENKRISLSAQTCKMLAWIFAPVSVQNHSDLLSGKLHSISKTMQKQMHQCSQKINSLSEFLCLSLWTFYFLFGSMGVMDASAY